MSFGRPENIQVVGPVREKKISLSIEEEILVVEENKTALLVAADKAVISELVGTLNLLGAFKASVETYGLTKSLIAFADHDKSLSSAIPEVPSIESVFVEYSVKSASDVISSVEEKTTLLQKYIDVKKAEFLTSHQVEYGDDGVPVVDIITKLNAFKTAVEQYGLTRSLVSFANYDNSLTNLIPELPDVKSLLGGRSPKHAETISVIKAVEAKIIELTDSKKKVLTNKDLLASFSAKIMANEGLISEETKLKIVAVVSNFFAKFRTRALTLVDIEKQIKLLCERVHSENRVFDKSLASATEEVYPDYNLLIKSLKEIQQTQKIIYKILSMKLPGGEIEYKTWITSIRSAIEPVSHTYLLYLNEDTDDKEDSGFFVNYAEANDLKERSMLSLGYDSLEKLFALNSEFSDTLQSFSGWESLYSKYEEAHEVSGISDGKLFRKASEILFSFVVEDEEVISWLRYYPIDIAKSIFDCTTKK